MFRRRFATSTLLSAYWARRPSMKSARVERLPGAAGAVVGAPAVHRIDVLHFGVDLLELVAALERVRARRPRVVDLRVVDRRILPLRVGLLTSEVRVAGDQLCRQPAGDPLVRRQARDPELIE